MSALASTAPTSFSLRGLASLFILSGFAALIYQIVWQRTLFTAFGVNIESITLIVAVFMFGLGIGSLVGGTVSKRFPHHLLYLLIGCEVAIGLFGLVSLPLIRVVAATTLHGSLLTIGLAVYALLCVPTVFMGATLPIFVAYLHQHDRSVGRAVGTLYYLNTVGSAIACFATIELLFAYFGQQTSVTIAAGCNFLVVALIFRYVRRSETVGEPGASATGGGRTPVANAPGSPAAAFRFLCVLLLSGAVGYLSLSQEIVWMRALAYATGDRPEVFAYVLGSLLLGIAFGSRAARRLGDREPDACLTFIAYRLALSTILYAVSLPLIAWTMTTPLPAIPFTTQSAMIVGLCVGYLMVFVVAYLTGGVFPALCHYAIRTGAVGQSLSWIYFANIVGSTAGPLLTGFVLLDRFTLEQNAVILSWLGGLLTLPVALAAPLSRTDRGVLIGGLTVGAFTLFLTQTTLYASLLEHLQYKAEYPQKGGYRFVVQNRSGIIAVEEQSIGGDAMYGGGMYDGRFNLDPALDSNLISRAYMVAALHPDPQEVLEIGLSTGSWSRVLADHPGVRKLTIVEINRAYPDVVRRYPDIGSVLDDPRVTAVYDDGRRWLNRHPDARFDVIVMNTTWHWRSQITNLLSDEFLRICKSRLKPGGVLYYNSTQSDDVAYTAAQVFPHVVRYLNFVAASDHPFDMTPTQRRAELASFRHAGRPVFTDDDLLDRLANYDLSDLGDDLRKRTDLWHITDDNMATEYKRRWHRP